MKSAPNHNITSDYVSSRRQAVKIECFRAPTAKEIKTKLNVRNAPLARVTSIYIFAIHKAGSKIRRYNKIETSGNQSSIGTFDNTTTYVKSPAGRNFDICSLLDHLDGRFEIHLPTPYGGGWGVSGLGFLDFRYGLFGKWDDLGQPVRARAKNPVNRPECS